MKRLMTICVLFFLCFQLGNAQIDTQTHTVSRGETILQIAKKYNVTPYDIQQANRETLNSLDDIKENDVLIIPKSKIITPQVESASDAVKASLTPKIVTYTVKKGDTKFGLAKRFGVSIGELEGLNPQIVAGLNEGHVLKINSSVAAAIKDDKTPISTEAKPSTVSFQGYKDHLVLRGETLWGISHSNGLTVEQLVGENSAIITGILREGQTLKVPQIKEEASPYQTYIVKYGDTKYSLSKKYATNVEALEQLNPQIVRMLLAGQVLRLPLDEEVIKSTESIANVEATNETPKTISEPLVTSTETTTNEPPVIDAPATVVEHDTTIVQTSVESVSQTTSNASDNYVSYEVKSQETLYGLSKKAGMSTDDFVALNPQLKQSVQVGMIIKMPSKIQVSGEIPDVSTEETAVATTRYVNLATTLNSKSKHLLFVLPINEVQFNEEISQSNNFAGVSDTFKKEHLEFYSGAKIAIDSLNKLGLTVAVDVIESDTNKRHSKLMDALKENQSTSFDAILLPFYDKIENELATMVTDNKIPMVTAANIAHQQNNNTLFAAVPSINDQRSKMLDFMLSKQANLIVVSDVDRSESHDFIASYAPGAQFVPMRKNGTFKDDDLISLFKPNQMNYVVLESDRNSVFLNVTNIMLSELNRFELQLAVLETTLIPNTDDVSAKRYRILKMMFPSVSSIETQQKLLKFSDIYKKVYTFGPSTNAVLGFDITFDTVLRLAQARSFEYSAKNDVTEYVKLKFDYKLNPLGGYNNKGIYILQYDTDANIREVN